jgi:hypothetical protein
VSKGCFTFYDFFCKRNFVGVGGKTKQLCMLLALAYCYFVTSFDLWMSKGAYNFFALVINFGGVN